MRFNCSVIDQRVCVDPLRRQQFAADGDDLRLFAMDGVRVTASPAMSDIYAKQRIVGGKHQRARA